MLGSRTSIGIGTGISSDDVGRTNLFAEGVTPNEDLIYDTICYVVICAEHERMALRVFNQSDKLRAIWLPFVAINKEKTWERNTIEGLRVILNIEDTEFDAKMGNQTPIPIKSEKRIHYLRTIDMANNRHVTRITHFVTLAKGQVKCCIDTKHIRWMPLMDVINNKVKKIWGPEVRQFAIIAKENVRKIVVRKDTKEPKFPKMCGLKEYSESDAKRLVCKSNETGLRPEQQMVKDARVDSKQLEIIYEDYYEHCFPSISMTLDSFKEYLIKYEFQTTQMDYEMFFNCFDINNNTYLTFDELVVGLSVIDPKAKNSELRTGYVFKYYDVDNDKHLNLQEFRQMIKDLFKSENNATIDKRTTELIKLLKATENRVSQQVFKKGISDGILKDCSALVRSPKSIISEITKSVQSRESVRQSMEQTTQIINQRKPKDTQKGTCPQHRLKNSEWAGHMVVIDECAHCIEPRLSSPLDQVPTDPEKLIPTRVHSMAYTFNCEFVASALMDEIRHFNREENNTKGLLSDESDSLFKQIQKLCTDLEQILLAQDRIIHINSSAIVVGDISGNLKDLLKMEELLWNTFPLVTNKYVFLGNYCNSGKYGIESILYLLSMKIRAPKNVFLLRGLQETRDIQTQGTFRKECLQKHGDKIGKQIWQMINNLFDILPVALIIDEMVFCTPSGIPRKPVALKEYKIKQNLANPMVESVLVRDLLSNEPTVDKQKTDINGFIEGSPVLFNGKAVKSFLERNGLTHIIRGNKNSDNGFDIMFDGSLLTLCSQSNDNEKKNWTVIGLVNKTIHIIRLDTTEDNNSISVKSY